MTGFQGVPPKKKKTIVPCRWLREHSASVKPARAGRFVSHDGEVYITLSNGQYVHLWTARKMGVV